MPFALSNRVGVADEDGIAHGPDYVPSHVLWLTCTSAVQHWVSVLVAVYGGAVVVADRMLGLRMFAATLDARLKFR